MKTISRFAVAVLVASGSLAALTLSFAPASAEDVEMAEIWAAIAGSPFPSEDANLAGGVGMGMGLTSEAAEAEALGDCKRDGTQGCELVLTYQNSCGSYARGPGGYGAALGGTQDEAKSAALAACTGSECRVNTTACISAMPKSDAEAFFGAPAAE